MTTHRKAPRDRILEAAAALLAEGGREAVSTRAVSSAARVQPPTIYRQFGDMRGLLDAVASEGFAAYLRRKRSRKQAADPVDDLRAGWDLHVEFGVANPAVYTLMYGDPRPGMASPSAVAASAALRDLVQRVAESGRLRMSVERAAQLIHAAGVGVTLTLIGSPAEARDPMLSETTREAILEAVAVPASARAVAGDAEHVSARAVAHAVALKAALEGASTDLSSGEIGLLGEWLDRIAAGTSRRPD